MKRGNKSIFVWDGISTRTVIAFVDNPDFIDNGVTPAKIVEYIAEAAVRFYQNFPGVTSFRILKLKEFQGYQKHLESISDYDSLDQEDIEEIAWMLFAYPETKADRIPYVVIE
jgi:hypothetical protein